jgi:hypothetical protein
MDSHEEDVDRNDPFAEETDGFEPEDGDEEEEDDGFYEDIPSETDDEFPALVVWVNAGFGNRSYQCRINRDSTMTIPDPLVRELDLHPGDDLDFDFDEAECILYISKKVKAWEPPEWMED